MSARALPEPGQSDAFDRHILDRKIACVERGVFRLRSIRELVRRDPDRTPRQATLPALLDEQPIIRPLGDYGQFSVCR